VIRSIKNREIERDVHLLIDIPNHSSYTDLFLLKDFIEPSLTRLRPHLSISSSHLRLSWPQDARNQAEKIAVH